jgi:hypothetical protein
MSFKNGCTLVGWKDRYRQSSRFGVVVAGAGFARDSAARVAGVCGYATMRGAGARYGGDARRRMG